MASDPIALDLKLRSSGYAYLWLLHQEWNTLHISNCGTVLGLQMKMEAIQAKLGAIDPRKKFHGRYVNMKFLNSLDEERFGNKIGILSYDPTIMDWENLKDFDMLCN